MAVLNIARGQWNYRDRGSEAIVQTNFNRVKGLAKPEISPIGGGVQIREQEPVSILTKVEEVVLDLPGPIGRKRVFDTSAPVHPHLVSDANDENTGATPKLVACFSRTKPRRLSRRGVCDR